MMDFYFYCFPSLSSTTELYNFVKFFQCFPRVKNGRFFVVFPTRQATAPHNIAFSARWATAWHSKPANGTAQHGHPGAELHGLLSKGNWVHKPALICSLESNAEVGWGPAYLLQGPLKAVVITLILFQGCLGLLWHLRNLWHVLCNGIPPESRGGFSW